jgi:TolB-like protein/DNA-binding winged helix-turn-helix (wHTH) protein/Tfp pilus assembly protein PilF
MLSGQRRWEVTDFRFGRFELDSRTRELRKDGVRVKLQHQPFAVLALMLEHPGELLTREELRERLWPDGTFVDFEHGLNAAVKRLRSVLGDSAERPRFVETLHRRGYRFIARVEHIIGGGVHQVIGDAGCVKQRLAVLPFIHLGQASVPDSFAGGLTEELMTQLGRLGADRLGVIARSSSQKVQRADRTVREIADALRAQYLVEGTVRTDADRVRVTAQLIDARSETQLWADSYDRPIADSLLVQADVATKIVRSVAIELLADKAPTPSTRTRNVGAYQNYLKGRYHWNRPGDEGILECLAFYKTAVQLDPGFAAAHGAMARATVAAGDYYLHEPRTAFDAAEAAAARALSIDPTESEALVALAEVRRSRDWDWEGAEEAYRRALSLNPSNEAARRLYGVLLGARRRHDAAAVMTDRAFELDPLCLVAATSAAWVRYVAGHYDDVIERCRHTIDMDPSYLAPHRLLAAARLQTGDVAGSVQYLDSILATRRDPVSLAWLAHGLAVKGDRDRAVEILCQLDELAEERYVSFYHRALAHAGLGDFDTTFTQLWRACEQRDPWLMHLPSEPRFDVIRTDPRYGAITARLGLNLETPAHA